MSNNNSNNGIGGTIKLVFGAFIGVVILILLFTMVRFTTVHGNEYGIMETWRGGVQNEVLQPKTYVLFPGFMKTIYTYDGSSQVFVMNDKPMREEHAAAGREKDAYLVQSQEGQDMHISLNLRWRIDPAKLVSIHKTVRKEIEEKIIHNNCFQQRKMGFNICHNSLNLTPFIVKRFFKRNIFQMRLGLCSFRKRLNSF